MLPVGAFRPPSVSASTSSFQASLYVLFPLPSTPFSSSRSRGSHVRVVSGTMAVGLALSLVGCGTSSTLNGAGASFPAPIYQRWFQDLASKSLRVNYQSVGSGAGVRQFISRTVDFAASDVPMQADDLTKVQQGVVQIPMTAGAIAVAYQNKGCALSLSQAQLVAIVLGKINDYSVLGCAAKPIKVVVHSDGSHLEAAAGSGQEREVDCWHRRQRE